MVENSTASGIERLIRSVTIVWKFKECVHSKTAEYVSEIFLFLDFLRRYKEKMYKIIVTSSIVPCGKFIIWFWIRNSLRPKRL
ncbi:hypothetical protein A2976_03315 [candidate division WWE3 bacterium RIFCSPLOWO2_01_FULL_41_9]|uniref:Uncharacterized protein n=1 Tax=candidate division WWE3 bacterium RIFCSPLOWO2_01_FULL_41_9 TaxID=1802626 RepID=A0A1F4VL18_UNCKA|nr:MAG: hypothetical protein A2976_03315 [candidate division WWE3 bacterium RIFCSPLOWO2_01_FULL_41_9]